MLAEALAAAARQFPDRIALDDGRQSVEYGDLVMLVEEEGARLAAHGERFGLLADNGAGWAIADLALQTRALPSVPLPGFFTAAQVLHALDDAGIDCVVTDDPRRAREALVGWHTVGASGRSGLAMFCRRLDAASRQPLPRGTAKITYTSGSTGQPKGVCLSAAQIETIARTLQQATASLGIERHLCLLPLATLLENIAILAKARLAERWGATEPRIEPHGTLSLRGARHPLLVESRRRRKGEAPREDVVPIDDPLTPDARVLVVTGPNAGGKTVALKTVGLLTLMVQAGLHIPASPDSELPVFFGVYADIGDEQSIAQDLSTFSAHISRLRTILAAADRDSLVLLDEIGAGTDPGEGAALGNAILDALASRGAQVVATTHLDGIKAFVAQDTRMQNGAVEFDLDRMQPLYITYREGKAGGTAARRRHWNSMPPPAVRAGRPHAGRVRWNLSWSDPDCFAVGQREKLTEKPNCDCAWAVRPAC